MATEFRLPDLGENIESGDVVSVLVGEGDTIEPGQNVLELETDKAVVELPCDIGGTVQKVHVSEGDSVSVGSVVLTIDESGEGGRDTKDNETHDQERSSDADAKEEGSTEKTGKSKQEEASDTQAKEQKTSNGESEASSAQKKEHPSGKQQQQSSKTGQDAVRGKDTSEDRDTPAPAGPATRRLARELGVDLHQVSGSGPGGRITESDVRAYVKQQLSGAGGAEGAPAMRQPELPDFSKWGPVQTQAVTGVRKATMVHMATAWSMIPHVTHHDLADITELEAARKRYQSSRGDQRGKITITVLAIKAAVSLLRQYPQFNASLDAANSQLITKQYYHVGVAVDTEHGLLVPVIRDADRKSVPELAMELETLAEKARDRKLGTDDMRGGTFTITNLGGIGGTAFTPIVNWPEVAILGMARARKEQVLVDNEPQWRLMMPVSLSYDHRVIDGADAARFVRKFCMLLADPMQLLFEG